MPKRTEESCARYLARLDDAGLTEKLRAICHSHYVGLKEIYLDVRGTTITAARLEVWWWLMNVARKSLGETSRLFDRDHASLHYSMSRLGEMAVQKELDVIDESNIHLLALAVAQQAFDNLQRGGKKVHPQGVEASIAKRAIRKG